VRESELKSIFFDVVVDEGGQQRHPWQLLMHRI